MIETSYRIPLEPVPQRFNIALSGKALTMETKWNDEIPAWELSLFDGETGTPLVASVALVTGADLLEQHAHLGIPGQLVVHTDGDQDADPTLDNLGRTANLYYLPI